ncbi:MAG: hypothetical protein DHS20C02_03370 [Micavibrio sp.]|nr:MAG: hypothetical protein DHS20C02_03370 [Micavibrio sp.]
MSNLEALPEIEPVSTTNPEHNWESFAHGLRGDHPEEFIQKLYDTGELKTLLPEVEALFGVPQTPEYHPEIDTGIHTLMTLKRAAELSDDLAVRYAALVHDLGKALTDQAHWPKHHNHEELGVAPIQAIKERLGVPEHISELAEHVARYHLHAHRALESKPGTLVKLLERTNALGNPGVFEQFILAAQADAQGRLGLEDRPYPQAELLRTVLQTVKDVETQDSDGQELSNDMIKQRRVEAVKIVKNDMNVALD